MSGWIDISMTLRDGMVHWRGDPEVRITRIATLEQDGANVTALSMGAHVGTHVDAPLHFVEGSAIDRMPVDALTGPARVVGIEGPVTSASLEAGAATAERLLLRTRQSPLDGERFSEQYDAVTPDGARWLVERGVRAVGIDTLSIGPFGADGDETHRILLGAGVWVIEGLDLSAVEPGDYDLVCLPLKIEGADGAPARAMVRAVAGWR